MEKTGRTIRNNSGEEVSYNKEELILEVIKRLEPLKDYSNERNTKFDSNGVMWIQRKYSDYKVSVTYNLYYNLFIVDAIAIKGRTNANEAGRYNALLNEADMLQCYNVTQFRNGRDSSVIDYRLKTMYKYNVKE